MNQPQLEFEDLEYIKELMNQDDPKWFLIYDVLTRQHYDDIIEGYIKGVKPVIEFLIKRDKQ